MKKNFDNYKLQDLLQNKDFKAIRDYAKTQHSADMAKYLSNLLPQETFEVLTNLTPQQQADIVSYCEPEVRLMFSENLSSKHLAKIMDLMSHDDRCDFLKSLPEERRNEVLKNMTQIEREDIKRLMSYPEGTVGSVTTSDFVHVSKEMTVTEALNYIRATASDKETIYIVYVLDSERKLCGTVSLRDLVMSESSKTIQEIMNIDTIFVRTEWPATQATELMRHYDLLALPVINGGNEMIGIITIDDAMDIEKEKDATRLARFGGTASLSGPDLDILSSPLQQMFKVRFFWLMVLTFFGVITSTFVANQEEILSQVIVLAAFIAPIVDMGGNAGSQSATLVIRSMALGQLELRWKDVWLVIKRELPVAGLLGMAIAVLEIILAYFSKGIGYNILLVVGLSMLACTVLGGIIGSLLPFLAKRIGTDPATLSSPLITSIMDLLGVFIYFAFAYALLGNLLIGN